MRHFIITRQQHLIERTHSKSVQANTILVTGIPSRYLTQNALFKLFNSLPGGVKKIWINRYAFIPCSTHITFFFFLRTISDIYTFFRNLKELPDIYDRRLAACSTLESAETSLLKTATKLRLKAVQTAAKNGAADIEAANQESIQVPESERPTHKLGFLGLYGQKVDSINWAREEIATCTQLLEQGREKLRDDDEEQGPSLPVLTSPGDDEELGISAVDVDEDGNPRLIKRDSSSTSVKKPVTDVPQGASGGATTTKTAEVPKKEPVVGSGGKDGEYPPMNSAFVTFERQVSAHLAVQVLAHHEPYRMS
jgi:calcium permeable stress-gated cation channel